MLTNTNKNDILDSLSRRADFLCQRSPLVCEEKLTASLLNRRTRAFLLGVKMRTCKRGHLMTKKNTYICAKGASNCRKCRYINKIKYQLSHPWKNHYDAVKQRCRKKGIYYRFGIRVLMTLKDFEYLWNWDKAFVMKKPSIHRINTFGDYHISNCCFLEFKTHMQCPNPRKRKPVNQFDLNGNFIKRWDSHVVAKKELGLHGISIGKCVNNKCKTAGGYIWRSV